MFEKDGETELNAIQRSRIVNDYLVTAKNCPLHYTSLQKYTTLRKPEIHNYYYFTLLFGLFLC